MNKFYDDFDTQIQPDELDIEGIYNYINNEDDNEYVARARSTWEQYYGN
jgi:hypothetical protein